MRTDVLVITPPKDAGIRQMISRSYPGYSVVDSAALRAAAVLEEGGFKVGFLPLFNLFYNFSARLDTEDLLKYIRRYETDIVLQINDYYTFSRSTPAYEASLYVAQCIKEHNPNTRIVLAGNHVSCLPRSAFLDSQNIDVVVKMEGEPIFCGLVECLQKNASLEDVTHIVYREHGVIRETPGQGMVEDLDSLPVPAYHFLREWTEEIPRRAGRVSGLIDLTVRTSYGCPNKCAFCGVTPTWNACRFRSADRVSEDIHYAREALKGKKSSFSYFDDENFTSNANHVTDVSHMMQEEGFTVNGVLGGVPELTRSMAEEVSKFAQSILVGAENAVDSILARAHKNQTFEQVLQALKNAGDYHLKVDLQWLIGLPGETTKTMAANLNAIYSILMKGSARSVTPNVLGPQPGSDIGDHPEDYGITICSKDWTQYYSNGAYPSFYTETLNRDQIYVYYLWAKIVASEISQIRPLYDEHKVEPVIWGPEDNLFATFMQLVGSS